MPSAPQIFIAAAAVVPLLLGYPLVTFALLVAGIAAPMFGWLWPSSSPPVGIKDEKIKDAPIPVPSRPPYQPTAIDVLVVRSMMAQGLKLPVEIINDIFDDAEYWPHTTARLDRSASALGGAIRGIQDKFILRTRPLGFIKPTHYRPDMHTFVPPTPRMLNQEFEPSQFQQWIGGPQDSLLRPCRKIVFTIRSQDQGWGGTRRPQNPNIYDGSYSWFEVGLERYDADRTQDEAPMPELYATNPSTPIHPQTTNNIPREYGQGTFLPTNWLREIIPAVQILPANPLGLCFDFPILPDATRTIQHNVAAKTTITEHVVVWSWSDQQGTNESVQQELLRKGRGPGSGDGEFVRNLKLGDVITVWAKARFSGWRNSVESMQVDVYWAF